VYRKLGLTPASTPYFSQVFSEIIEGVESQVKARGYHLLISYMDERSLKDEIGKISGDKIEGILILATEMGVEQFEILEGLSVPMVILDNYIEDKEFTSITINNEKGVFEAISYFNQMGHKNIGYLHIMNEVVNFSERYYGYFRAMRKWGMYTDMSQIVEISAVGVEGVYEELKTVFSSRKEIPTAFFADNDIVAMCAMRVFREMGYRIPEDISIIGFDNMTLSELLEPPLTTIHIPKFKMGVIAANTIIDSSEYSMGQLKIEVGTDLVIRKSVLKL
jgi:DNA-binding LacI/PurR family transcriptional regulator